jgi:hypothetical protein
LVALLAAALVAGPMAGALAQEGSAGGSIGGGIAPSEPKGGGEGGHRPRPREARPAPPAPRRAAERRPAEHRGVAGYDGAWAVSSNGQCGPSSGHVTILGGRVTAPGVSGSVTPSGVVHTVGNYNGLSVVSTGRITGATASGSYRRSDGCTGAWSATKM